MKRQYEAPELELLKFRLNDVLTGSGIEDLNEQIETQSPDDPIDIEL